MNQIHFEPGKPVILCIADPDRECQQYDPDLQISRYQTTDGRRFTLPRPAVVILNALELQPGEEIGICRRTGTTWDIWLTPRSEQIRAAQEQAEFEADSPSETEILLQASLDRHNGKRTSLEPVNGGNRHLPRKSPGLAPTEKGTGTNGPAALPSVLLPARRREPPEQIPWNVAFREVAQFVARELARVNLQWSDEAQKSAVCTVLIEECKRGRISRWERSE
jgi:hypothetical protein